jgi:hypothetical protein
MVEEPMRVENAVVQQPLVDRQKITEKKDFSLSTPDRREPLQESVEPLPFIPSPFGSSGTYSISSLRAAVDYHVKFLTVADSNLEAASHPPAIPKRIIDQLVRKVS